MRRVVALALLVSAWPAAAQTVRLHVLADSVTVGERFEVAVAVEHGAGIQTVFAEPPGIAAAVDAPLEAGEAELLALRRLPPSPRGTVRVDSAIYTATTFALDSARVGPVVVRLVRGGDTTAVRSPVAYLDVRSLVPADAEGAQGLAPLAEFPRALAPWLLAGLAALALLAALLWWLRRRPPEAEDTSLLAPRDEFVLRLGRLETSIPKTAGAVKPFYVELADALRTYLARSLGVRTYEVTSRELIATLNGHRYVPDEARDALAEVLRRADFVKFAEFIPSADLHPETLTRARRAVAFIEAELHPEPEPEAEPA